ncbi:OmpA family protein [Capnocytophaga sputigena]|jgi:immunogenic 75 kDa protein PG4|uniref:OmpA family protein n=1 Tax=Capnocytophaga sputigena TaxID=1019 RepID=UPI0028F1690D|nr:OmpA family protein [Capnocytophaga sputigena]
MRKIILAITLSLLQLGYAQSEKEALKKAAQYYKNLDYVQAINAYESIAKKGVEPQELLENLGNAYYYNADYQQANKWYAKLFEGKDTKTNKPFNIKPEYYYRYAQTLKTVGDYDNSDKIMDKFVELVGKQDTRAALFLKNRDYQAEIKRNSGRLELNLLKINTKKSEYGTAFYGDNIVYATSKSGFLKRRSDWTGDNFYSLYEANTDSLKATKKAKLNGINTKFNESTAAFTKDGNTMYFTRNNFINNEVKTNGDQTVLLKIFKATKDKNGKWGDVQEMPFNSNIHSVAHPALSPDGKYIYFSSDMKGTLGSSDIYRAKILKSGYGKPENLGDRINTSGRESFPFISDDNVLYYSSDGFPGLGGLDIYAVKLDEEGNPITKPVNIGRPANSAEDDFCYVINSQTKIGYLTSNRPEGKGSDDIYSFYEHTPLHFTCQYSLSGVVKDADTKQIIPMAKVTLWGANNTLLEETTADANGNFTLLYTADCGDLQLLLKSEKEAYKSGQQSIALNGNQKVTAEVLLTPIPATPKIEVGTDLAKVLKIENIYFDYDKANIRKDAAEQLAKIVAIMKEYPTMKVDVRLHTDSRGSDKYNLALSERRAKSTIKWIVSHGIKKNRITGKGYGETQLVNGCANDVPCTEEEHQANRRSEFIIVHY